MKPNKDTEYDEFVKWSENLCDKRHDKLVELRKKKVVNNPFKKWFYLGKKVKSTVYKVTAFVANTNEKVTIDTFTRKYQAENFIKNFNTTVFVNPSIEENTEKVYSIEDYYSTPYDKLRWKAIKKWQKKIEKHGLEIKRPYFYYGKEKYHIWNSHLEHGGVYKKFCSYWWKDQFEKIVDIPKYHYKTCWYDYSDLFSSLIVKLTIKGLFLGLHGNAVTHKEQMHEIWEVRKELIKAYNFEDYYEWKCGIDILKDNPNSEWYKEREEKYKECLNNAFGLLAKNIRNMWD